MFALNACSEVGAQGTTLAEFVRVRAGLSAGHHVCTKCVFRGWSAGHHARTKCVFRGLSAGHHACRVCSCSCGLERRAQRSHQACVRKKKQTWQDTSSATQLQAPVQPASALHATPKPLWLTRHPSTIHTLLWLMTYAIAQIHTLHSSAVHALRTGAACTTPMCRSVHRKHGTPTSVLKHPGTLPSTWPDKSASEQSQDSN
eukprot:1161403-Pelagomonas_calceolata.AAC.9